MSLFNTNLLTLARQLVPALLQTSALGEWVKAVAVSLDAVRQKLIARRAEDFKELNINGQVCRLERVLNDLFDPTLRRIYIEDDNNAEPLWLRQRAEAQPVFIRRRSENQPTYIFTRPEFLGNGFLVMVPVGLVYDAARMRALVNKYRIPSSSFTIKTF